MRWLLLDGDEEKGQIPAGHALDSIDVKRRLDVVAEIGDGARETAAAGIETALEIDDGRLVEPVGTTPAGEVELISLPRWAANAEAFAFDAA